MSKKAIEDVVGIYSNYEETQISAPTRLSASLEDAARKRIRDGWSDATTPSLLAEIDYLREELDITQRSLHIANLGAAKAFRDLQEANRKIDELEDSIIEQAEQTE